MAWNTPGSGSPGNGSPDNGNKDPSSGGGNRNPWKPRQNNGRGGGGGLDDILAKMRGYFDGGNGNPWRWLPVLIALWLLYSCFVLVTEQQRGVVLRFGKFDRIMTPGPSFKLPWPIESVTKINATEIKNYSDSVSVLTSDENIVKVDINVQYRISDPKFALYGTRDADEVLRQAAISSVREQVGRSTLDTVLGARDALAIAARERLDKSLEAYNTGLVVTELNLPNARPPEEVKPAFDDVNSAQQDKDRLISESRAYAAKIVPEARGQASRIRTVSEGYKTAEIARATGDATRFSLLLQQYRGAPEVTRKRLWLETVQKVLAENRKVVGGDSRQILYLPMNSTPAAPRNTTSPPPEMIAPIVTATPDQDASDRGERRGREGGSR